ncbi:MAG: hypothetical protein KY475_02920 [Planctomycetes bacterium]|nr:hypothetical protein [Planctomycetota bacterium]
MGASFLGFLRNHACNCFGTIELTPIDRLIVAALVFASGLLLLDDLRKPWLAALLGLLVSTGVGAEFYLGGSDESAILGATMPAPLRSGEWSVTVVRPTCPACYDHLRDGPKLGSMRPDAKTALLVLGAGEPRLEEFARHFDLTLTLRKKEAIGLRTPFEVHLRNGRVVWRSDDANSL